MIYKWLRRFRIVFSSLYLILSLLLFIDVGHFIQSQISGYILFFQFVPSLLSFIFAAGIAGSGFIFIIVLTLMFGRLYCSFLCPLGTLQDVISFVRNKILRLFRLKKFRFVWKKPHNIIRYGLLSLTALVFLTGNIILINLLDPYSIFGKLSHVFFRHWSISLHNTINTVAEKFNIYFLYPIDFKPYNIPLFVWLIALSGTILFFAWKYGRLYCNTICPVGSLLGLVSKISLFKIKFDESKCTECGLCNRVCKSECVDYKLKIVDESRCISCFNCLSVCPENGMHYRFANKKQSEQSDFTPEKRKFLLKTSVAALALSLDSCKKITSHDDNKYYKKPQTSTPPGSISREQFNAYCTACQLCVSVCPTQVLQPSIYELGIKGFFQPYMDYPNGFCSYECTACLYACPTGAIKPMAVEQKKLVQIGVAKLAKDICVCFVNKKDCGACSEQCPTKAVNMVPSGNISVPEMNEEICIGCGACEHACPTKPYKAIYVEANLVHKTAKKPRQKKLDTKYNKDADFPF